MSGKVLRLPPGDGNFDNPAAAETAEGAIKPEAGPDFTEAEVIAATIAVWSRMKRQQLADVPALESVIEDRLTYMVMRRLENQILAAMASGRTSPGSKG
jgi:HK97 family phage major capsid protein